MEDTAKTMQINSAYSEKLRKNNLLRVNLPLLPLCSGILFALTVNIFAFSQNPVLLLGKTQALPLVNEEIFLFPSLGMLLGVGTYIFCVKHSVLLAKIATAIGIVCMTLLFFNFEQTVILYLFNAAGFCTGFLAVAVGAITLNLFSIKTAWQELVAYGALYYLLYACYKYLAASVPYWFIQMALLAGLFLLAIFLYALPKTAWPAPVTREQRIPYPKKFVRNIFYSLTFAYALYFFAENFAKSVPNGTLLSNVSAGILAVFLGIMWKYFSVSPFRYSIFMLRFAALGALAAVASLYYPFFAPIACVLLGGMYVFSGCIVILGIIAAKILPSTYVTLYIIIALMIEAIIFNEATAFVFQNSRVILYALYAGIAVLLTEYLYRNIHKLRFISVSDTFFVPYTNEQAKAQAHNVPSDTPPFTFPAHLFSANGASTLPFDKLNAEENAVLYLTLQGYSKQEMLDNWAVSFEERESLLAASYSKLGVKSEKELMAFL